MSDMPLLPRRMPGDNALCARCGWSWFDCAATRPCHTCHRGHEDFKHPACPVCEEPLPAYELATVAA